MKATHLRVQYLDQPLGLGNPYPQFSWHCEGGIRQSAYQIICERDGAKIWDSGKVESSAMTQIIYAGAALKSRDQVRVTVTLWDENGELGEASETCFEMGLLSELDWKASWISGDYTAENRRRYPVDCFRKEFRADKPVVRARLYASARGLYDVTLNGKRIEDFQFAPGMTDYRKRIQYQTYDVTGLIQSKNQLELRLADGWYRGSSAAYGVTNVYGKETSVIAQLEMVDAEGNRELICTNGSFSWSNDGPIRFADLKDGESYDARMTPSYSGLAKVVAAPKAPLVASDNVPVKEKERLSGKLLENGVIDFGQNIAGYLEFTVQGKRGQKIVFTCGEILDAEGNVDLSDIQIPRPAAGHTKLSETVFLIMEKISGPTVPTPLQEVHFVCSGGVDHYKTSFAVFGFRYAQVKNLDQVELKDVKAIAVYSDMEATGDFICSNEMVNQLVKNTRWSMKSNFLDLPTDCPTRERLGWTGDAQIFFNTGAYFMDTAAFFAKWLRDMEDAIYKEGFIPSVLPYQGVEMMYKNSGMSVGWADAVYLIPYRYYLRFGDRAILEKCYPMMKKYVDYVKKHLGMKDKKAAKANPYNAFTYEKGLHLGEWLEPEEFQEKISAGSMPPHPEEATAYLYLQMKTMEKIADILGKSSDAKEYAELAAGAKKAYDYLFVKTGSLDTNRQAKIVRPLALGLLDGAEKEKAQARLAKAVEDYHYHVETGFLSTPFVLPVLTEAGETELAYKMLENTESPGWLSEIVNGATTIWESWEGNVSRNHYSPGAVCEWLFNTVAGITVDGENHFVIAPKPGGTLTFAKAEYVSVYGKVESGWKKDGERVVFTVKVPANTMATVVLPDGTRKEVGAGEWEM